MHNRDKQEVGRRVALNALRVAYGRKVNTGPTLKAISQTGGHVIVTLTTTAGNLNASFRGSHDCIKCCAESAFETSVDGNTWTRAAPQPPTIVGADTQITLGLVVSETAWLRYSYDWLVQCPVFDSEGLPLAPFKVQLDTDGGDARSFQAGPLLPAAPRQLPGSL